MLATISPAHRVSPKERAKIAMFMISPQSNSDVRSAPLFGAGRQ